MTVFPVTPTPDEPKKIYVRALVPPYVRNVEWDNRGAEYTPWVVGSTNRTKLTNEVLDAQFDEFAKQIDCTHDELKGFGDYCDFIQFLEEQGYVIFSTDTPGVWKPA